MFLLLKECINEKGILHQRKDLDSNKCIFGSLE